MKIRRGLYERYLNAQSFYKLSVFKGDRGWIRMEPDGPWLGTFYPTWESAMRGEQ